MTALDHPAHHAEDGPTRVPFPVVDEVSRHCLQEEEPETVHIEVHLPGTPDPDRLRAAFHEALRRHPRILMREAKGPWYRRRYEWELTGDPDTEPVSFPPPEPDALKRARERALAQAPPLTSSPPIRLEVVAAPGTADGRAADGRGRTGIPARSTVAQAPGASPEASAQGWRGRAYRDGPAPQGTDHHPTDPAQDTEPRPPAGSVLFLTINHTALDGPACLRVLATAAEIYGGRDNSPAAPPSRTATEDATPQPPPDTPSGWSPPARVAKGTPEPSPGNGMLVAELPVPRRPKGSPFTVNDQLMVATALMIAHWNREHGARPRPFRITMPVDDRPRDATMPIGNGTRLVEVPFSSSELTREDWSPEAIRDLLRRTSDRTRALKALARPQLGHGAALLTAPVLPVTLRAAVTRGLRRAAAPWTSTTLLSNIGRVPYALDFGDAGRAHAVWFSAPARLPRGLTVTTASTAGRLHVALRWSKTLLSHGDGAHLRDLFEHYLHATEHTEEAPQ
ncbi:condensation protein [Streptomyces kanamyceticus]|uniref:Condensation protein n=1 Tax=Streptomyces kanamyceticus TaxID=1967 RepID=A0A5J6GNG3_STRKN|nr:condensation protein [Streptomyces kanamyceticus]QEU94566.1 condensation protein [Streptomyces kanamyceticus]